MVVDKPQVALYSNLVYTLSLNKERARERPSVRPSSKGPPPPIYERRLESGRKDDNGYAMQCNAIQCNQYLRIMYSLTGSLRYRTPSTTDKIPVGVRGKQTDKQASMYMV